MVIEQIAARGVRDPLVLAALQDVPRHSSCHRPSRRTPTRIAPGDGQTISQPSIVALMTSSSGHERAIAPWRSARAPAIRRRCSPPRFPCVHDRDHRSTRARGRAASEKSRLHHRDRSSRPRICGSSEIVPFDLIVVTAAPEHVPPPLVTKRKPGGRLVIPVGSVFDMRQLQLITKDMSGQIRTQHVAPVAFVPLLRGR